MVPLLNTIVQNMQKFMIDYIHIKAKCTLELVTKAQRGVEVLLYSFFNLGVI
jgi:hypothetical protein